MATRPAVRSRPARVPCGPAAQLPGPPASLAAAAASMVGGRVQPSVLCGGSRPSAGDWLHPDSPPGDTASGNVSALSSRACRADHTVPE